MKLQQKIITKLSIYILVISNMFAQEANQLSIEIKKINGEIQIDGYLNEIGWQNASSTDYFLEFQPGDNSIPPVKTEVLLAYDPEYLFVAFICHDDSSQIRASYLGRDRAFNDDFVGIMLDTYGDANSAITIMSNPFGIQMDTKNSGNNDNVNFDLIYSSAGKITKNGYQVEIAIPFSSLTFPKVYIQNWKISFYRSHPRVEQSQMLWGGYDRENSCMLCQMGNLKGLKGIQYSNSIELLQSFVGGQSGYADENGNLTFDDFNKEVSIGIKYPFSSNSSVELTINPDFSQVESDADQININTTFALYYPEKRPFFNAGEELFDTPINVFYSRSINNPSFASKFISRSGVNSFALITAIDEDSPYIIPSEESSYFAHGGESVSNIFRFRRSLNESSYFGILFTDRRMKSGSLGSLGSFDIEYRLNQKYNIAFQSVLSYTIEPNDSLVNSEFTFGKGNNTFTFDGESFLGNAVDIKFSRGTENWNLVGGYRHHSPSFRTENGFISSNNNKYIYLNSFNHYWFDHELFKEIRGSFNISQNHNFEGMLKKQSANFEGNVVLLYQTNINGNFNYTFFERFKDSNLKNLFSWNVNNNSQINENISIGLGYNAGNTIIKFLDFPEKGIYSGHLVWGDFKITNKLNCNLMISYQNLINLEKSEEYYSGYLTQIKINYNYNSDLSFQVLMQYNGFSESLEIQPLLTYQPSPFTIFYLGSKQNNKFEEFNQLQNNQIIEQQYFLKFQYLFKK